MNLDDVYSWGAIAVIGGPVAAGLAIPIFQWAFQDVRRLALLLAVVSLGVYLIFFRASATKTGPTPSPTSKKTITR